MKNKIAKTLLPNLIAFIIIGQTCVMEADKKEEYDKKWSSFFESPGYNEKKFYEAMKVCDWSAQELLPPFLRQDERGRYILSFDGEIFKSNRPDYSAVRFIFEQIEKHQISLKEIHIIGDIFTEDTFRVFCQYLKKNESITGIQLRNARLARFSVPTFDFHELYEVLKERSTRLLSLDISGMHFCPDDEISALLDIDALGIQTINIRDSELPHDRKDWTCMLPSLMRTLMDGRELIFPFEAFKQKRFPLEDLDTEEVVELRDADEDVFFALGRILAEGWWPNVTGVIFRNTRRLVKFGEGYLSGPNKTEFKQFDITLFTDLFLYNDSIPALNGLPLTSLIIEENKGREMFFSSNVTVNPWVALFSNPFLSKLVIKNCSMIPSGLCEALSHASNLTCLIITGEAALIDSDIANKLLTSITFCKNLEELVLPNLPSWSFEKFVKWFEEISQKGERPLLSSVTIGDKQFP